MQTADFDAASLWRRQTATTQRRFRQCFRLNIRAETDLHEFGGYPPNSGFLSFVNFLYSFGVQITTVLKDLIRPRGSLKYCRGDLVSPNGRFCDFL